MPAIVSQVLSGLFWIVYGSFFEWYWHRFWMHEVRKPTEAFRGHAIVHHGLYKGDDRYFVPKEEHAQHILLKPYALPAIVVVHLPIVFFIEKHIPHTAIGGITFTILYFVIYEYMHWNMHVPRDHFVERFKWFHFLRQHHKLHHQHPQKNFCVLLPLADAVCGTMVTDQSLERRRIEREAEIAAGKLQRAGKNIKKSELAKPAPNSIAGKIAAFRADRAAKRHAWQIATVKHMVANTTMPERKLKQPQK